MNKSGEENRSVRNTRRRLREGLLRLLEEKPLHEISVKELTELADVNRGTFYFHYQDIYDLLGKMEDDFFAQFDRTLSEHPVRGSEDGYPYLHAIFSFLDENRDFCRIMLGPHGDMKFVDRVKQRVDAQCSFIWQLLAPETAPERYAMYNAFIINGCIGLIQEWLSGRSGLTEENVTELAAMVILASVGPCIH
ncbi:MAG: TetR/AcrR family transcriptional regulator C-terminal domain-containing protein [Oscillospiraceae bacterium]|nr:TetR/AcrR family transcriptional regulator C-terminal domain-containing protein [Oscillospiraceae bacterium]